MALDCIGVGGCGGKVGGRLAVGEGLAEGKPALPIGAIARAMGARLPVALAGDVLPLW